MKKKLGFYTGGFLSGGFCPGGFYPVAFCRGTFDPEPKNEYKKTTKIIHHHDGDQGGYERQDVIQAFGKCEKYELKQTEKERSVCLFRTEIKAHISVFFKDMQKPGSLALQNMPLTLIFVQTRAQLRLGVLGASYIFIFNFSFNNIYFSS